VDWDAFICHASEDKDEIARPIAARLQAANLRVWFDEFTLTIGDSIRRKIDEGLAAAKYGIVILSPSFFAKQWPQSELDGMVARERQGVKVILPVWHNLTHDDVARCSPMLADRLAVLSSAGLDSVIAELLRAMKIGKAASASSAHLNDSAFRDYLNTVRLRIFYADDRGFGRARQLQDVLLRFGVTSELLAQQFHQHNYWGCLYYFGIRDRDIKRVLKMISNVVEIRDCHNWGEGDMPWIAIYVDE